MTEPIIVNAEPGPDQLATAAQQVVLILGPLAAFAALNHMLPVADWLNLAIAIVTPLATLVTLVLGQIHTFRASKNQAAMASKLPDAIAQTK